MLKEGWSDLQQTHWIIGGVVDSSYHERRYKGLSLRIRDDLKKYEVRGFGFSLNEQEWWVDFEKRNIRVFHGSRRAYKRDKTSGFSFHLQVINPLEQKRITHGSNRYTHGLNESELAEFIEKVNSPKGALIKEVLDHFDYKLVADPHILELEDLLPA